MKLGKMSLVWHLDHFNAWVIDHYRTVIDQNSDWSALCDWSPPMLRSITKCHKTLVIDHPYFSDWSVLDTLQFEYVNDLNTRWLGYLRAVRPTPVTIWSTRAFRALRREREREREREKKKKKKKGNEVLFWRILGDQCPTRWESFFLLVFLMLFIVFLVVHCVCVCVCWVLVFLDWFERKI